MFKMSLFHLFRNGLDGVMVLGGSDPSLYEGAVSYINLVQPDWYRISVDG